MFGSGYTGMSGLVLAAEHPERVRSLVIVNGAARVMWAADYPVGADEASGEAIRAIMAGPGRDGTRFRRPRVDGTEHGADETFRGWWDLAGNRAASPSKARAATEVLAASDVRDKLARITAPTLILHRDKSPFAPVETRPLPCRTHRGITLRRVAGRGLAALDRDAGTDSRRNRGVRHRCPRQVRYRTCAHHNRFHRCRRLDTACRRTRRPPVA